jgi:hypothetical protein
MSQQLLAGYVQNPDEAQASEPCANAWFQST